MLLLLLLLLLLLELFNPILWHGPQRTDTCPLGPSQGVGRWP
jgi:hypothetical protein